MNLFQEPDNTCSIRSFNDRLFVSIVSQEWPSTSYVIKQLSNNQHHGQGSSALCFSTEHPWGLLIAWTLPNGMFSGIPYVGDHISKNWKKQTVTNTRALLEKSAFILFFFIWDAMGLWRIRESYLLLVLPSLLLGILVTNPIPCVLICFPLL